MSEANTSQPQAIRYLRPLRDFLATETAGGIMLVGAVLVALVWANSPWSDSYEELWSTLITVDVGGHELELTLREFINDGLMTLFFFVVGLEIKRELVQGELRDRRAAALPSLAALGGMVVPALFYLAFNAGGEHANGWGIPMATDIAMAVGVVSLLGSRVPSGLKLFLLALAIVDDIGAIVVIAVFYTESLNGLDLIAAVGVLVAVLAMRRVGVGRVGPYVVVGVVMWLLVHDSGVHATIAGVVLGLVAPTTPVGGAEWVELPPSSERLSVEAAAATVQRARQSVSVVEWLEHLLHPWTSFVIVPLFALANAGVALDSAALEAAVESPVAAGIALGLVLGKPLGITLFSWLAVRLGIGVLPVGVRWSQLLGAGVIAGIGFTVALFVTELAFGGEEVAEQAKVAILAASLVAALAGVALFAVLGRHDRAPAPASSEVGG